MWTLFTSTPQEIRKENEFDIHHHIKKEHFLRELLQQERVESRHQIFLLQHENEKIKTQTKEVLTTWQHEKNTLESEQKVLQEIVRSHSIQLQHHVKLFKKCLDMEGFLYHIEEGNPIQKTKYCEQWHTLLQEVRQAIGEVEPLLKKHCPDFHSNVDTSVMSSICSEEGGKEGNLMTNLTLSPVSSEAIDLSQDSSYQMTASLLNIILEPEEEKSQPQPSHAGIVDTLL